VADRDGWHGKALPADMAERAIEELGGIRSITITPHKPEAWMGIGARTGSRETTATAAASRPTYDDAIATRKAFGDALAWLVGIRPELIVLDGEVGNSTYTDDVLAVAPERFVEMYIAEQTMVGVAIGLQALGKTAFAATFGAFLTRALDQIRMGSISRADLRLCGSHAGVSIGEDGPSQMALEDLAAFRAIDGSTVLYPADGNATVRLVEAMADLAGISYLRTTREATAALYGPDDTFPVGGSKTLREGDDVTLVAAGITVHEALRAAERLAGDGVGARVLDCYSVKPIDAVALRTALDETGLLVVVEDHRVEGGLGSAVLEALASTGALRGRVVPLGVRELPGSGTPEELRAWAGIDADAIVRAVTGSRDA
jgi:transketolase